MFLDEGLEPLVDPVPGCPELDHIVEFLNSGGECNTGYKVVIVHRYDVIPKGSIWGYIWDGEFHWRWGTPIYTLGHPEPFVPRERAEYFVIRTYTPRKPVKISLAQFKFTDWKELNGY